MPTEIDKTDARQARKGFGVIRILTMSLVLVAVAMAVLWIFSGGA